MSRALCLLLALTFAAAHGQEHLGIAKANETARVVTHSRALSKAAGGIDGALQLLQDARLTPSLRKQLWGSGEASSDGVTFQNAAIRTVSPDGKTLESEVLERPLATLESVHLYGDSRTTYLITVDYSAGFGSYSGPATLLLEISDGR